MNKNPSKITLKLFIICLIWGFVTIDTSGQDSISFKNLKNSIHLDGATALYVGMASINYERTIVYTNKYKLNLNCGFGRWYSITPGPFTTYYGWSIPIGINNLIGARNNYFEVDLGARYNVLTSKSDDDRFHYLPIFNLGYRYQRLDGRGLMFRAFVGFSGIGIGTGKMF
jgi:hypothetical protein